MNKSVSGNGRHPQALDASLLLNAPPQVRITLEQISLTLEAERERLRPELGKGNYHPGGFRPHLDTVDTMSWEDLVQRPGVIKLCEQVTETKASELLGMIRSHCPLDSRDALYWMHLHFLAIESFPEIAQDFFQKTAQAQKEHFDRLARAQHLNRSRKGGVGKNAEHRERAQAIKDVWATGKYQTRGLCAEKEWVPLGFRKEDTARRALQGTPDPASWLGRNTSGT